MTDYTDRDIEYPDSLTNGAAGTTAVTPNTPAARAATPEAHGSPEVHSNGADNAETGTSLATATSVALATRNGLSSDLPVLRIGWEPYQPTAWPAPWRFFVAIPIALLIIGLAAGSAFAISRNQPAIREARSEVRLQAPAGADAAQADRLLNTAAAAALSPSILEPLARRHGLTLDELEENVEVTVLPQTSLVQVSVTDELPSRALAVADALTGQLLTDTALERSIIISQTTEADLAQVNLDIAALQAQIDEIAAEPAKLVAVGGEFENLALDTTGRQARLENLLSQLREKLDRRTALELKRDAQQVDTLNRQPELVSATQLRPDPVGPRPVRDAALGAVAGSVLAAPIAALLLRFQPRRNRRGR